jgi:hypothetical protein
MPSKFPNNLAGLRAVFAHLQVTFNLNPPFLENTCIEIPYSLSLKFKVKVFMVCIYGVLDRKE